VAGYEESDRRYGAMDRPRGSLRVPHPEVLVKICGVTRVEDALACAELGADWIGLNFHRPSPRSVDPEVAAAIVEVLHHRVTIVGVFVDRPVAEVAALADRLGLDVVQLHGQEPPEDLCALERFRVIRAFRLRTVAGWRIVTDYLARAEALGHPPEGVLVDAYVPGLSGGTGTAIDASTLDAAPALPRLILAGGLSPANVAERIARIRPWMVDVASGVESAPGRKDPAAVAAFISAVRSSGAGRSTDLRPSDSLA
jgi:phosphoribosylanthranilate isomerase